MSDEQQSEQNENESKFPSQNQGPPPMDRFPGPPPQRPMMPPPMRPHHDGPPMGMGMRPPHGRFPPPFGQGFLPNQNFPTRMGGPPPFGGPSGPHGPGPNMPPTNTTLPKPPIYDKDGQAWLEACSANGKVYYFNAKTRETKWEKPDTGEKKEDDETEEKEEKKESTKKEDEPMAMEEDKQDKEPEQQQQEPPQRPNQPPPNMFQRPPRPQMGPPPGMPPPFPMMQGPPGMIPPGFPPAFNGQGPPRFPPFPGFSPLPPPDFMPKTIGDWTRHRLPDGQIYYYNNKTKESKWDKPKEFDDSEKEDKKDKKDASDTGDTKDGKKEVSKDKDQKKPVASRSIAGTIWHLVWTGDGRVFFFSPSTKTSIWERPKELEDNTSIDDLLRKGPPTTEEEEETKTESKPGAGMEKPEPMETGSESKAEEVEPVPKKKKRNNNNKLNDIKALPILQDNQHHQQQQAVAENANNNKQQVDPMREADVKRSIIPLDERMTMFTQLLREKQVSAFSTWEKELHKILFDPRYLLLTMKERKNCYEKYVRVRAVEERKERVQKLKEKKEEFKQLLDEVVSSSRLSFSDFASKNSKDARYKGIDKMRDRESLFNEFMTDFRKHEKERLRAREQKLRTNFFELLGELNNLDETSEWRKAKGSIETDKRYELVGSSSKREQFFNDYVKELLEKRNPEKEKEEVEKDEKEEGEKDENEEESEKKDADKKHSSKEPPVDDEEADEDRKLDEKYERMEASLRKREAEVRAQKELYEKDREKERGIHMHDKAVQHFNALLADMVKDTQYTWKETRRTLRKDPRWSALDVLDKETKESLFEEHTKDIGEKRKKSFRRLLEDADVPLDAYWRDVRRQIKDDPRYAKFGNSEKREEQFEVFIREKTTTARNEFRELLRETKTITYKSKKLVDESNSYWKDIKEVLKKDKRYHVMSTLANERDRLIMSYITELHKRGPPPPPTATNPAARYKTD